MGALTAILAFLGGCGGSGDRSKAIAAKIGVDATCYESAYLIKSQLDGSESRIYNCVSGGGPLMCVIEQGGLAKNITEEAKLLFANTLGGGRPQCLG